MAERATKEVLLRLRRVRELELRRALTLTRAARAEARRAGAAAEAARRALEAQLERAAGRRVHALAWPTARAAGRLAQAEGFEQALRRRLAEARQSERKALAALDAAEGELAEAQRALGDAVHARQRSETMAASERAAELRARARREQGEVEDRYRTTPNPIRAKRAGSPRKV
jgi:hypothetical protein